MHLLRPTQATITTFHAVADTSDVTPKSGASLAGKARGSLRLDTKQVITKSLAVNRQPQISGTERFANFPDLLYRYLSRPALRSLINVYDDFGPNVVGGILSNPSLLLVAHHPLDLNIHELTLGMAERRIVWLYNLFFQSLAQLRTDELQSAVLASWLSAGIFNNEETINFFEPRTKGHHDEVMPLVFHVWGMAMAAKSLDRVDGSDLDVQMWWDPARSAQLSDIFNLEEVSPSFVEVIDNKKVIWGECFYGRGLKTSDIEFLTRKKNQLRRLVKIIKSRKNADGIEFRIVGGAEESAIKELLSVSQNVPCLVRFFDDITIEETRKPMTNRAYRKKYGSKVMTGFNKAL